jgi:hypothetical protein
LSIGVIIVAVGLNTQGGESGIVFVAIAPVVLVLAAVSGMPVSLIYKRRNRSLFKK